MTVLLSVRCKGKFSGVQNAYKKLKYFIKRWKKKSGNTTTKPTK